MNAPCIVIQQEADSPPGLLATVAANADVDLAVVHPYRGDTLPDRLDGASGLIVLGGRMGAYDDALHPWLTPTKRLIGRAAVGDLPLLGLCLGHQLTAVALGGQARIDPHGPTLGLRRFHRTPSGHTDPLLRRVSDDATVTRWHGGLVSVVPPGADVLARDEDDTPLAVRYGPAAWGIQGHPEVTADIVHAWASGDGQTATTTPTPRRCPLEVAGDVLAQEESLAGWWMPLFEAFFDVVRN